MSKTDLHGRVGVSHGNKFTSFSAAPSTDISSFTCSVCAAVYVVCKFGLVFLFGLDLFSVTGFPLFLDFWVLILRLVLF